MQSKRRFKDICQHLDQLFEITGFDTSFFFLSGNGPFCLFAQIHTLACSPGGHIYTWDHWAHLILDTFMFANCKS